MSFQPAPFAGEDDILLQARPPACDTVTYLTLLEYQLTPERLPLLHDILQDETLTSEIGWDLVKTLVKFVPESRQCLNDVARLGNPREVILSVAQALEGLRQSMQGEVDNGDDAEDLNEEIMLSRYEALLEMLPILQSRLVSKFPSRFLGSALEAVLTTFMELPAGSRAVTATMDYLSGISGVKKPPPPPRNVHPGTGPDAASTTPNFRAGDPENERPSSAVVTGQREIARRLAQFALLESLKIYLSQFTDGMPCMNWALRIAESQDPRTLAPHMRFLSATEAFKSVPDLIEREAVLTRILNLADDFGIDNTELINIISKPEAEQGDMLDFESVPQNPNDINLERHGCLLLLAARNARWRIHGIGSSPELSLGTVSDIFAHFSDEFEEASVSSTPEATTLLDSLLALMAGITNPTGELSWDLESESYETLMKNITTCTQSTLYKGRLSAQKIATKVFSANPVAQQRYDLLCTLLSDKQEEAILMKEPAIGWFKNELIQPTSAGISKEHDPFADPVKLSKIITVTFSQLPVAPPATEARTPQAQGLTAWMGFIQTALPIYLAYLNFYHFLTQSRAVLDKVPLKQNIHTTAMAGFFEPMRSSLRHAVAPRSGLEEQDEEMWDTFVTQCRGGIELALGLINQIEEWGSR